MKGEPFGYFPREKCPFCSSHISTYPYAIDVINKERIAFEWLCLACAMVFRTYATPAKGGQRSEVQRSIISFPSIKPKTRAELVAIKKEDMQVYLTWKSTLEDLKGLVERQRKDANSNRVAHFFRVFEIILVMLIKVLEARVKEIQDYFRSGGR